MECAGDGEALPNVTDITEIARAVEAAADAVLLIITIRDALT